MGLHRANAPRRLAPFGTFLHQNSAPVGSRMVLTSAPKILLRVSAISTRHESSSRRRPSRRLFRPASFLIAQLQGTSSCSILTLLFSTNHEVAVVAGLVGLLGVGLCACFSTTSLFNVAPFNDRKAAFDFHHVFFSFFGTFTVRPTLVVRLAALSQCPRGQSRRNCGSHHACRH